jgi:hypothetical protein
LHVNVAGVSAPARHDSAVPAEIVYPAAHAGVQEPPDATVVPAPHIAEFATVGSVHASALHANVAGVRLPAAHDSAVPAEIVYPAAHVGAHDIPDATLPPAPHIAEFATVGSAHAFASHDGATPLHVPPT